MVRQEKEEEEDDVNSLLITSLPLTSEDVGPRRLRNYRGFWYPENTIPGIIAAQEHYKPRESDVILCSQPKCGTTWLKALSFSVLNRKRHHPSSPNHPLLSKQPHELVLHIEAEEISKLDAMDPPRLLSAHLAYSLLPESTERSGCRIVYICREPKDNLVSAWHFMKRMTPRGAEPLPFCKAFDTYCKGVFPFGPIWEQMLEYYRESQKRPSRVLFLNYEDLLEDTAGNLRRLAEFVGCGFSEEEEEEGLVEEIVRLCSFDSLSGLEVNRTGQVLSMDKRLVIKNSSLFRKGKVGDWKNHLTDEMAKKLDEITEEKLCGSGLRFGNSTGGAEDE